MAKKTIEERFHEKYWTEPMTGCWLWVGSVNRDGYGEINHSGSTKKAHRASYELHQDPIPEGMEVCHRCDVPGCVAPHHLFLGTRKENMEDAARKGRMSRGEGRTMAKLTEQQVREIYSSTGTTREIAKAYGISSHHVSDIKTKKKWKHLHYEEAA